MARLLRWTWGRWELFLFPLPFAQTSAPLAVLAYVLAVVLRVSESPCAIGLPAWAPTPPRGGGAVRACL